MPDRPRPVQLGLSRESLAALQERVRGARREDRRLDADIARALLGCVVRNVSRLGLHGRTPGRVRMFDGKSKERDVPRFTGSIDAACDLVEKVLPGAVVETCNMHEGVRGGYAYVLAGDQFSSGFDWVGESVPNPENRRTVPLAILLALLAALSPEEPA